MDQSTGSSETESAAQHYLRPRKGLVSAFRPRPEESLIVAEEGALITTVPGILGHQHHFSEPVTPSKDSESVFSVPTQGRSRQKSYYRRHPPRGRREKKREVGLVEVMKQRKAGEMLLFCLGLTEIARLNSVSTAFQTSDVRKLLRRRRRELILAGLPPSTRLKLWQHVASPVPKLYPRLCMLPNPLQSAITADIERTNATESLSPVEKLRIYRILNGLGQLMPDVGYCQCLVFITALLVKGCLSEEQCFWLLHRLLTKYNLKEVVACGFEQLRLLCYQFDCFLNEYLSGVAEKLRTAELSAELYALRWLLTLFSYELPRERLYVLWDLFFVERWKVMIRAGLALVQVVDGLKDKVSGCELFCLLRSVNGDASIAQQVLSSMHSFKVTTRLMTQLTSFYQQSSLPTLHLVPCSAGPQHWEERPDEFSDWAKMQQLLDETLCMEDLTSPGGPLNPYFQSRDESSMVCSYCGSGSHSALYCDKEEAAQSFCSSNLA